MPNRYGFLFIIFIFGCFVLALAKDKPPLDLEPIVISKSKIHFTKTYALESNHLKYLALNSAIEALSALPLDLQSRSLKGGIQTDFSLRGSTFQGVLLLLDGQRINDSQTGHHNSDIPLTAEDIERIEVIPGAASSVFGPDAIGGAINFIVKKPKSKKMVLELAGGQYQTKLGLFSISEKKDNLGVRISLENQESAGFYEDTDFKKFTAALASILEIPDREFIFDLGYLEKEFGAYDFYTPGLGYLSYEWTKTYLVNTGFNLDRGGLIIKPNFLWRRHYDKFLLDKTLSRSRYLNHHRTDVYTPNIYLQNQFDFLGKVGGGLEYGEERMNSTNLGKHNRQHQSIFLDESRDLTKELSLGLSWRMDDFDGFDRVYTGSANLRYNLSEENAVSLGISRSTRIPSFTELYYNDPTTLGDASLSAEKSLNYQLGYEYKKQKLSWGATFFLRQEEDFIDWVKRTSSQAKWQVENITAAEVFGIENYLKLDIGQHLHLDSNYTYIDRRVDDKRYLYKYGPNYIRHLCNNNLIFALPFGTQTIGLTYKKKPHRTGWLIFNTRLCRNLTKNSQLFLEITNLLNVEYQEIEGIPSPGRWTEAGLRFEW